MDGPATVQNDFFDLGSLYTSINQRSHLLFCSSVPSNRKAISLISSNPESFGEDAPLESVTTCEPKRAGV